MHASSIADVVTHLQTIVSEEAASQCRIALFPALYCELTQRFAKGLKSGEFRKPKELEQIGVIFANRYFDALVAYRNGGKPTKSWAVSFEQAKSGHLLTIQDLLLGINAHINLDLAIATAQVGGKNVGELEADFQHVNVLLEDLFDRTYETLGSFSPFLDVLDRIGQDTDEWLGNFVIRKARDGAWVNAVQLAGLEGKAREVWIGLLDISTSRLGTMIANPNLIVRKAIELIRAHEEQDVGVIVAALAKVQA